MAWELIGLPADGHGCVGGKTARLDPMKGIGSATKPKDRQTSSSQYWDVHCVLSSTECDAFCSLPARRSRSTQGLCERCCQDCGKPKACVQIAKDVDGRYKSRIQAKLSERIARLAGATTWRLRTVRASAGWNVPSLAHQSIDDRFGTQKMLPLLAAGRTRAEACRGQAVQSLSLR